MSKWTEEQLLAINSEGKNIIVSAGAGSGKTAVLSERVLRKINDNVPIFSDCSIAGIKRLQMDAATITPAANPASARCTCFLSVFFIKSTHAAPSVVPMNGISIPRKISIYASPFAVSFN